MSQVLPPRKIGGASVPPIGFGAMGISSYYGKVESDEERFKVLDAAYEKGCWHWDSAHIYGDSEELIGKWYTLPLSAPQPDLLAHVLDFVRRTRCSVCRLVPPVQWEQPDLSSLMLEVMLADSVMQLDLDVDEPSIVFCPAKTSRFSIGSAHTSVDM